MSDNETQSMNPTPMISMAVLAASVVIVHLLFTGVVRPFAEAAIAAHGAGATSNFWVILKDFEQQACLTIGIYCMFLMVYKSLQIKKQEKLYTYNFLEGYDDEDSNLEPLLKELESSQYRESGAMATWITCIRRFLHTKNVQHASDAISSSIESLAAQLEAGNNVIRYIIWAIPSIGFVGTVRGIGAALAKAEEAVGGDISGMVDKLGVAFNSTLVSLLISIVLMYLLHQLNNRQDMMVLKTQKTCEDHLLSHLHK